jgi:peptide/nickel transport system substrate-binding protein
METTWRIRPGITWHDGRPFTTADLVFAATVGRDPELAEFGDAAFSAIDRVEAPDPLTITVYWKRPFIDADAMFAPGPGSAAEYAEPMPFHILGPLYAEDKSRVRESTYWTTEFVGHGAFQVREFVVGGMVRLEAYPSYALGRPKIDGLEVRFITSTPTLVANVLAGEIEMTIGRGRSLEQGLASGYPAPRDPAAAQPGPRVSSRLSRLRAGEPARRAGRREGPPAQLGRAAAQQQLPRVERRLQPQPLHQS